MMEQRDPSRFHPGSSSRSGRSAEVRPPPFGIAGRRPNIRVDDQPVPILHEHARLVPEERGAVVRLLREARIGIRHRAVRRVRPFLAPAVHALVAQMIIRGRRGPVDRLDALAAGPGLEQRPFDSEKRVQQAGRRLGKRQHFPEERVSDPDAEPAVPIPSEDCGVPDGVVQIQPDEPAVEQVVAERFHELAFVPDRIEHLEQQGTQEVFGRNRRPAFLAHRAAGSGASALPRAATRMGSISRRIARSGRSVGMRSSISRMLKSAVCRSSAPRIGHLAKRSRQTTTIGAVRQHQFRLVFQQAANVPSLPTLLRKRPSGSQDGVVGLPIRDAQPPPRFHRDHTLGT